MKPTLLVLSGGRPPALVRLVLLLLCTAVAATGEDRGSALWWAAPLAVAAALASLPHRRLGDVAALTTVEGLLTGTAIAWSGSSQSPYLPYLIAPAFAGGLRLGILGGVLPVGAAAAVLLLAPLVSDERLSTYATTDTAEWAVLAVLVAFVASWVRAVLAAREADPRAAQIEAFRLLSELRDVARHLPGTLDPASTAEAILDRTRDRLRYDVGAVLVGAAGDRQLTILVRTGGQRPAWDLALSTDGPLSETWVSQHGVRLAHRLSTSEEVAASGSALVVPLVAGARTVGLLVLESGVASAFPEDATTSLAGSLSDLVLQLQTGLVFAEVRELATYEERRRLAREIHDGIAQELASVAYALDTLAFDVSENNGAAGQVEVIRKEVRRLITELRMSLFDLRSDIAPDEGLGAAISRHVHQVGTASGMTVHLSLNEAPVRLSADTEAELLRIVQEAVANARKHARASNLWVTCTVDPPTAIITVEDDGLGVAGEAAVGSHGLAIMKERASRIRADLRVEPREPRGTRVRVSVDRLGM